mgnify:CR=1 FL=1
MTSRLPHVLIYVEVKRPCTNIWKQAKSLNTICWARVQIPIGMCPSDNISIQPRMPISLVYFCIQSLLQCQHPTHFPSITMCPYFFSTNHLSPYQQHHIPFPRNISSYGHVSNTSLFRGILVNPAKEENFTPSKISGIHFTHLLGTHLPNV